MESITIQPVARPFKGRVSVPGSKSITNRALPLAALCEGGGGELTLTGVLFADDTLQMIRALEALGYELRVNEADQTVAIVGRGRDIPVPRETLRLICGNSGTTIRFLAAMLSLADGGEFVLDGVPRMRQRPIGQLVDQLRVLGAEISYELADGFPPVIIRGLSGGLPGGACSFSDAKSSQYISAVLMAAPCAREGVDVNLVGPITSEPYVTMTLRMMEQFGVTAAVHDQCVGAGSGGAQSRTVRVSPAKYRLAGGTYAIEPDASNASYFLAAAAIVPGAEMLVEGLGKESLQGDVAFAEVLARMGAQVRYGPEGITVRGPADGALRGVELDMNHIPDMVQTLAVTALFARGQTVAKNIWNLRVKETDRLAALEAELRKLDATVETGRDFIRLTPPEKPTGARIATYDDHRMAMAFAVAALRIPGIEILDPNCVAKTFPNFFELFQQVIRLPV